MCSRTEPISDNGYTLQAIKSSASGLIICPEHRDKTGWKTHCFPSWLFNPLQQKRSVHCLHESERDWAVGPAYSLSLNFIIYQEFGVNNRWEQPHLDAQFSKPNPL